MQLFGRQAVGETTAMPNEDEPGPIPHSLKFQPAYVLFASMFARNFYATVPTHKPIPSLLLGPAWRFACILKGSSARPACLRRRSAVDAMKRDGFYLFCAPEGTFRTRRGQSEAGKTNNQGPDPAAAIHLPDVIKAVAP